MEKTVANRRAVNHAPKVSIGPAGAWLRSVLLVFGVVLGVGFTAGCGGNKVSDRDIEMIDTVSLNALVAERASDPNTVILIDPRRPVEFETAHLPGAINLQLPELTDSSRTGAMVASYDTKVVYGQNPGSAIARATAKRMLAMGFERVRLYLPGLDGWFDAGLPVETDVERSDDDAG